MYCKKIGRECYYYDLCNKISNNETISNETTNNSSLDNYLYGSKIHNSLFELGIKRIIKLENFTKENIEKQANNIDIKTSFEKQIYLLDGYEEIGKMYYAILIGKNKKDINKYILIDRMEDETKRIIATGKMLGYPNCCIKGAVKTFKYDNMREKVFSSGEICPLLSNKISLFVHNPCSTNCINTINDSEKVLKYLEKTYSKDISAYYFSKVIK